MDKREYNLLNKVEKEKEQVLTIKDLEDKSDRTLLYGYTCNRDNWHVYVKNKEIEVVIYEYDQKPQLIEIENNNEYVPDKRLYPEKCDYEFCKILKEKNIYLPFTTWDDKIEDEVYYGETA